MKRSMPAGIAFTQSSKNGFFAPYIQGRHITPINVIFGTVAFPCQILRLSGHKGGNIAPKTVKILPPREPLVCTIFYKIISVCTRLEVAFKVLIRSLSEDKQSSYKHFPSVGAFSHKFLIAPGGETTDRIKKS